ncbi:cytochrome P450 monooxygenase [Penicillium daleae]|uniref:Cytochrome P450 monooxygenase n=1 Tax=Penicillium daleae TaxID=63821 RepID=A0AAD6C3Z0_9EURO|nr:cytochrome P450 monooxygenase [Penicillium daleae]KAJ5449569.1 cytochrome P450 monooxygenase [Penicillium daleae]
MMLISFIPSFILSHVSYGLPDISLLGIVAATLLSMSLLWCVIGPKSLPTVDARTAPDRYSQLIKNARKIHRIFTLKTYAGPITILPPEYIDEVRNDRRLSLAAWFAQEFCVHYAGFELFRPVTVGDDILQDSVKQGLSNTWSTLTPRMAGDAGIQLEQAWGTKSEWQDVPLNASIDGIVQYILASVLFDSDLNSREDWLSRVTACSEAAAIALTQLRKWPPLLRPLLHWLLPSCWRLRNQVHDVRRIIDTVIAARRSRDTEKKYDDAIDWLERSARGRPYDAAMGPMVMFFGGTDTLTDMLTQVLSDLCGRPELVEELRQEVMDVTLGQNGWRTQDLHRLRLMDSVLKESQRLKPFEIVLLRRMARETVRLSDGTRIPKGSSIGFSADLMRDASNYANPNQFHAHRFLQLRDTPGYTHKSLLATPSVSHIGFGCGLQSCPGRFFAAGLMKILLTHIVMKYDIRASVDEVKLVTDGFRVKVDPEATLSVRRRLGVTVP